MPSEFRLDRAKLSSLESAKWAFTVLKYFAIDGGNLQVIKEVYKEHEMFCVWDVKADDFEEITCICVK